MKVLINTCYGGFGFSEGFVEHANANGFSLSRYDEGQRSNQELIALAEAFGLEKVNGMCANLEVRELPDGLEYSIDEYDGVEHIEYTYLVISLEELKSGIANERLDLAVRANFLMIGLPRVKDEEADKCYSDEYGDQQGVEEADKYYSAEYDQQQGAEEGGYYHEDL